VPCVTGVGGHALYAAVSVVNARGCAPCAGDARGCAPCATPYAGGRGGCVCYVLEAVEAVLCEL